MHGDGGVDPCTACVPACFSTGMSPAPLCRNTVMRQVGGRAQALTFCNNTYFCPFNAAFQCLFYRLAHFLFSSRTACLWVSLFPLPSFPSSRTANIPFSLSTLSWAQSDEAIMLLVHSTANYISFAWTAYIYRQWFCCHCLNIGILAIAWFSLRSTYQLCVMFPNHRTKLWMNLLLQAGEQKKHNSVYNAV